MSTSFTYRPLTKNSEIRVLLLEPASNRDATLKGSFQHIDLLDHYFTDPYTALSYVWGNPTAADRIVLDSRGSGITITANLAAALRDIRHSTRVHHVWVDALCINQQDIPERNQQVPLMRDIYYGASRTIIYLGSPNPEAELILRRVSRSTPTDANTIRDLVFVPEQERSDNKVLREALDALTKDLVTRPWFERVWTYQELILSKDPWVQFGRLKVQWTELCNIFPRPSVAPGKSNEVLTGMNRVRDAFHVSTKEKYDTRKLWQILKSRIGSRATDPRDMIYANLGVHSDRHIVKEQIKVDYNKTIRDVFIEAGHYVVKNGTLGEALYGITNSPLRSILPSWVPDWGVEISPELLKKEQAKMSGSVPSSLNNDLLFVTDKAYSLDVERITSLIPPPESFPSSEVSQRALGKAVFAFPQDTATSSLLRGLWTRFTVSLSTARPGDPHPTTWLDGLDNRSVQITMTRVMEYFIAPVYRHTRSRLAFLSDDTITIVHEDVCLGDSIVILAAPFDRADCTHEGEVPGLQMVTRRLESDRSCKVGGGIVDKPRLNKPAPRTHHCRLIGRQEMRVFTQTFWKPDHPVALVIH
ncbi:HET-domain-containing protein [Hypoxylon sp. FL1857]|nr:HET-domain-containing protein [Hypoxylon sp. FL1857]